jgi:glycosyltransferase involved in cell wall biosynthesis
MANAQPRIVSVIIGTRNRPDTLRVALASIRALEGPDLKFEILVGDNGTTPETRDVVAEFGGIYDQTDVYGCPAARNVAMKRVTGEFIAFLDDDDVWLPGHVRPHIAFLDAHPDHDAVFGQIVTADENLTPITTPWPDRLPEDGDVFHHMLQGYFPQVGATLMRRKMLDTYGLMDETLIGDSDWDWQLRVARNHKIGFVRSACVLFRQRTMGSFDKLQLKRTRYTRKIFMRHAMADLRRWRGPISFLRSYFGAVSTYHSYFMDAAEYRALQGDRMGTLRAYASAAWIFPTRAIRQFANTAQHRRILARALGLPVRNWQTQTNKEDEAFKADRSIIQHVAALVAKVESVTPAPLAEAGPRGKD